MRFEIKRANRTYLEEVVSDNFVSNPKKFWSHIKSMGQESVGVASLKNRDGFLKSDNTSKAEILNSQFQSVFTTEDVTSIPRKGASKHPDIENINVTEAGVKKLLLNLNVNKATGPDMIPAFILKTAADEITPLLTKMFQKSLDEGIVPQDWKDALVVPIFKKGDRHQPANYRPVSLTSITCKLLEHIVHSSVMNHLDRNNILSDVQHGFRKNRSCETQLIETVHDIAKSLARNDQVDAILLDFSKAFDKVPHQRLMHKLDYYGVRGNTHKWIEAFLSGRTQRVALEGTTSSSILVTSGVPQGTVLGPLLFLLYINDLPDAVKHSKVKLFADDSLLFRKITKPEDQLRLQQDLDALSKWENTWQMNFNPSKCNLIRILPSKSKVPTTFDYKLHGQTLETTKESKYLGVTITENLNWSSHIKNITAKGNRTVGFLRRNFKDCTTKVKSATYTAMVRPSLEYASTVWDPYEEKDKKPLEMVQRRAARYVYNNYFERTPGTVTNMIENLGWENLEERRKNNRLVMLYKIKHHLVGINSQNYLRDSDARTRGARLHQEQNYHKAICHSFFPRTISEWNSLPMAITAAETLEEFRSRLRGSSGLRPPAGSS